MDIYEREAELAFQRNDEIEKAALWCKKNYPHKFQFLDTIYRLLVEEERQYVRLGLINAVRNGTVKLQPTLSILTPSQALRLLESYKRATINDPKVWHTKNIIEIEKVEADNRRDAAVSEIRKSLEEKTRE